MERPPAVILSPHLDDAVLSCWHLLCGPGDVTRDQRVRGLTPTRIRRLLVGPGVWGNGLSDAGWRSVGPKIAKHSRSRDEPRSASNFLDEQYEPAGQTTEQITSTLRTILDPEAIVYAPAALGEHGDHARVRDVAVRLADSGQSVRLYADHPHAVRLGWPAGVDGYDRGSGSTVSALWSRRLDEAGLDVRAPVGPSP